MGIITSIIIGLIVGIIAKMIMPGPDPGGWITTILLGLGGSVVAGYFGRLVGWYQAGHPAGFLASIAGAVLLLWLYRVFLRQKRKP